MDVSYEVTAAGYWGRLDWSALMEQRRAMKLSHWVSLTTCLEAPGPFCSLLRASDRLVLGIVKQTLGGKALCYDWRAETASSRQNLNSAQTPPLLFTSTRSLTPMTSEMLPLVTSFYHSNSSHWCRQFWLTGKLERVAIAISPHQLHLWPRTIASLFRFSHSPFFFARPPPCCHRKLRRLHFCHDRGLLIF